MNEQIYNIYRLIDREIANTKEELSKIQTDDKLIERDIIEFLQEYSEKSKRVLSEKERDDFIKKKKEDSLKNALKKMSDLKRSFFMPSAD